MSDFIIYPAIDLRQGAVVRLEYGDPARQTVFGTDPVATARRWLDAGARWLHVVNLDGAFDEAGAANWAALSRLAELDVNIQFGGGLRSADDIARAFDAGAARVILGTVAVEQPALVAAAVATYGPGRVAAALDARDGMVRTRGWQQAAGQTAAAVGRAMFDRGVRHVIHTDIGRDGVLTGVNWPASQALAAATGLSVIASGGVAGLDDVTACVRAPGIGGVIAGRALYDGRLDLAAALAAAEG